MTDCEHEFDMSELWPPNGEGYPPIYNGGDGLAENGLPKRLEARVRCTECNERVIVSYTQEDA